jgi:hypothetical protein
MSGPPLRSLLFLRIPDAGCTLRDCPRARPSRVRFVPAFGACSAGSLGIRQRAFCRQQAAARSPRCWKLSVPALGRALRVIPSP